MRQARSARPPSGRRWCSLLDWRAVVSRFCRQKTFFLPATREGETTSIRQRLQGPQGLRVCSLSLQQSKPCVTTSPNHLQPDRANTKAGAGAVAANRILGRHAGPAHAMLRLWLLPTRSQKPQGVTSSACLRCPWDSQCPEAAKPLPIPAVGPTSRVSERCSARGRLLHIFPSCPALMSSALNGLGPKMCLWRFGAPPGANPISRNDANSRQGPSTFHHLPLAETKLRIQGAAGTSFLETDLDVTQRKRKVY
ncbi:hypothetical protein V8E51_014877 [Hyaloscypha variabilis]